MRIAQSIPVAPAIQALNLISLARGERRGRTEDPVFIARKRQRSQHLWVSATIAAVATSAHAQSIDLENRREPIEIEFGDLTTALTTADLDGDGRAEAIATNVDTLTVLRFDPSLRLASEVKYPVGVNATPAHIADFDGDGKLDAITRTTQPLAIVIRGGDGFGALPGSKAFALLGEADRLDVADFDLDGDIDAIVAALGNGSSEIRLALNDGAANLSLVSVGVQPQIETFFSRDVSNDGKPDVVLTTHSNTVVTMLGNGNGSFAANSPIGILSTFQVSHLEDLDSDGVPDLAGTNGPELALLRNDGTGTFDQTVALTSFPPYFPTIQVIADVTHDGRVDIVTSEQYYFGADFIRTSSLFAGFGGGKYSYAESLPVDHPDALFLSAGDFDADGALDLVSVGGYGTPKTIGIVRRKPTGAFAGPPIVHPVDYQVEPQAVQDLDHDGDLDVVFSARLETGGEIATGRNDAPYSGKLTAIEHGSISTTFAKPTKLVTADFDGDSNLDVFAWADSPQNDTQPRLARGVGDGSFSPWSVYPWATRFVSDDAARVADVNLDGKMDLLIARYEWPNSVVRFNPMIGLGNGSFTGFTTTIPTPAFPTGPTFFDTGDLDNDGRVDIVCGATSFAGATFPLVSYRSLAVNAWVEHPVFATPAGYTFGSTVAVGDIDSDGLPEPVVIVDSPGFPGPRSLYAFSNLGGGVFSAPTISAGDPLTDGWTLELADLDADGRLDVLSSYSPLFTAQGFRNLGGTAFAPRELFASPFSGNQIAADLDADGKPELVAGQGTVLSRDSVPPPCGGQISSFGQGCASGSSFALELGAHGCPAANQLLSIDLHGGAPNEFALLFMSTATANMPLGGVCSLYLAPPVLGPVPVFLPPPSTAHGGAQGAGETSIPFIVPALVSPGSSVSLQAFIPTPFAPTPFAASQRLSIIFG
jgi:FG-GAP-like repeat